MDSFLKEMHAFVIKGGWGMNRERTVGENSFIITNTFKTGLHENHFT